MSDEERGVSVTTLCADGAGQSSSRCALREIRYQRKVLRNLIKRSEAKRGEVNYIALYERADLLKLTESFLFTMSCIVIGFGPFLPHSE